MSLLSATQGSPERVWSLLRLLDAHGGTLSREELLIWLNPEFTRREGTSISQLSAANQTIQAALSLDLITADAKNYSLTGTNAPQTFLEFADVVHERLCNTDEGDPDRVLLDAYAWVVLKIEREEGFGWLTSWRNSRLADEVNHDLRAADQVDDSRKFNDTKIPSWRAWLAALGLQVELPTSGHYPYIAERLARELLASDLPLERELPAKQVLEVIAHRMPYVDDGKFMKEVLARKGDTPPRHLSRVLSVSLRDLQEEGVLVVGVRGDSSEMVQLAPDRFHKTSTASFFLLKKELARA